MSLSEGAGELAVSSPSVQAGRAKYFPVNMQNEIYITTDLGSVHTSDEKESHDKGSLCCYPKWTPSLVSETFSEKPRQTVTVS